MAANIRIATAADAAAWLALLEQTLGTDHVARQVYDPQWVAEQLAGSVGGETWVAEDDGRLRGGLSFLASYTPNENPVANVGRHLAGAESYKDGSAEALVRKVNKLCDERRQMAIFRVPGSDANQQRLLEGQGYVCAGFQPAKHVCRTREGVLFYVRAASPVPGSRLPISQSLPQIAELAFAVLQNLKLANPEIVRDGATGYPLQSELTIQSATDADYETARLQAQLGRHPVEISGQFNRGWGLFRIPGNAPMRALLGFNGNGLTAGLSFFFDEYDKCVRLVDSFAADDLAMGALLQHAVRLSQEQFQALYVEVDFLVTAPRALKCAEQLGFVPVAYLPGFYQRDGLRVDLVKMTKLNASCSVETAALTPHARGIASIVQRNFQDQKLGVGIINLLRGLHFFTGLGDGELAKVACLFTQKLYRPNERVFNRGDAGDSAFVVMRGQVDIRLEPEAEPVASIGSGGIFGEQAFLDRAPRNAFAVAAQPSILLVVQRPAFNALVQSEPHLGLVVMRNIALELSDRLRKANRRR